MGGPLLRIFTLVPFRGTIITLTTALSARKTEFHCSCVLSECWKSRPGKNKAILFTPGVCPATGLSKQHDECNVMLRMYLLLSHVRSSAKCGKANNPRGYHSFSAYDSITLPHPPALASIPRGSRKHVCYSGFKNEKCICFPAARWCLFII